MQGIPQVEVGELYNDLHDFELADLKGDTNRHCEERSR